MRIWADETDRAESAAFENGGSLQSLNLVKSGYFLTRSAFLYVFLGSWKEGHGANFRQGELKYTYGIEQFAVVTLSTFRSVVKDTKCEQEDPQS